MEYTRQVIDLFKMTRHGSDRMDDFNDAESKKNIYLVELTQGNVINYVIALSVERQVLSNTA